MMATVIRKPFTPPRKTLDGIPSKCILGTKTIGKSPLKPFTTKSDPKPKTVHNPPGEQSSTVNLCKIPEQRNHTKDSPPCIVDTLPASSPPAKKQKVTPPSSPPSIDLTHSGDIPQR
jgi:hypothetical protein